MTVQHLEDRRLSAGPLHSILWFASSNFFRQALSAVASLLRPILLSPELFGLFTTLRLIPTYAHYVHLGARHTMRYMTPFHETQGEHEHIEKLQSTVFFGTFSLALIVVAALLAVAFLIDWAIEIQIGLAICAATVIVEALYDHYIAEMKSFQRFKRVGLNNYLYAVLILVTSVVLIFWLGFYGALLVEFIVLSTLLCVMAARGLITRHRSFDFALFKSAIAIGGPTLLFDATLLMMRTADRVIIVNALGFEQLGYYGLGAMMLGYVMHIPGATREVMEGKLFQNKNSLSSQEMFEHYVMRPVRMVALTMPVLIGPMVLVLPVFVHLVLPDYQQGVPATQVLLLGAYFLAVSFPVRGILVACGWQKHAVAVLLLAVVLHSAVSMTLISMGLGILGVAISAGVSFSAASLGLFGVVLAKLPKRPPGLFSGFLYCTLPFLILLSVLYADMKFTEWLDWALLPTLAAQLLLFGLAVALCGLLVVRTGMVPVPKRFLRRARPGISS